MARRTRTGESCAVQTASSALMLILTRSPGTAIHIGDEIIVTVLSVSGQQVKIGISAPPSTKILREELIERDKLKTA
jgi:carbon storage regulator